MGLSRPSLTRADDAPPAACTVLVVSGVSVPEILIGLDILAVAGR